MVRLSVSLADRFFQALLIVSTIGCSWWGMMALHESGHVLHGWLSGARLSRVYLPLFGFSQTQFAANPHPLFVAWGGPLWGCLLPLSLLAGVRLLPLVVGVSARVAAPPFGSAGATTGRGFVTGPYVCFFAWFTGFCWIANGAYLLGGALMGRGAGDGGTILQYGGAAWQLIAFGIIAIPAGLCLWSGLGPYFGLGPSAGKVDRKAAIAMAVALAVVALIQFCL